MTDPRERLDGLGWVTRAIFPDPRLRLAIDAPGGALRYAVIPSLDRAKFLLPLVSRRVTAASLLAYNTLRPAKVRAGRAAVGTLARLGALGLLRTPVLSVFVPSDVDERDLLLTAHLATLLEHGRLHAAIGIRPPDPHHKPTLQLFDDHGIPRGYAKIGWNGATREMVRAEAVALRTLRRPGGDFPDAPRLVCSTGWQDREIALIEPMPRNVRRIADPDRPQLAAMRAVAGPTLTQRVRDSAFLAGLRVRAADATGPIHAAIDAIEARDGELSAEFGDWHGDWVPWNLATRRGRLLAWDWENSGSAVPLGFDLAHQAFQTALSPRHQPAPEATLAMDAMLDRHGSALGLDAGRRRFVADAYLVELWLRTHEIARGGAGWNRKLHPALLDVLGYRLPVSAATPARSRPGSRPGTP